MLSKKIEFLLMRKITSKPLMDWIINLKTKAIGKTKLENKKSFFIKNENKEEHIKNLSKDGYTILDFKLSSEIVESIVKYSEEIKCYDDYNDPTKPINIKNIPIETHVANYRRDQLVQFKKIMDIANDQSILQVVQEFLGAKPTISNLNMWWSFGGRKQAEHAQLFHRDMDDWRFCKLFIYLTDVNEKSGPHIYVKYSSTSAKLRKIKRYSDSEVEGTFGQQNVKTFIAPKGTAFIVDTYGFHKGLLPERENRLLLQIQYSLFPIGIEEYVPVNIENNSYDTYINRLIVK